MKRQIFTFPLLTLILCVCVQLNYSQAKRKAASELLNQMVSVGGRVVIKATDREKPEPVSRIDVYFQRTDCKKCIVAVSTNAEGYYYIHLSRAKYRVYVFDVDENDYPIDILTAKQNKFVDTRTPDKNNMLWFDVEISGIRPRIFPPLEND